MNQSNQSENIVVISPVTGREMIDFSELWNYRDLFFYLVWRDIKVMYAQTIMGFGWAILQPLVQILLFTIIFGKVAQIETDGIPYLVFVTLAIIPWTYMSAAMSQSSMSLVSGQGLLGKVYFPRMIFPLTSVLTKLVDFAISLVIIAAVLLFYQIAPTSQIFFLPIFVVYMVAVPVSVGFWLSALSIRYRDVKFANQFGIRMLMYTAPIVYTASSIPEGWRFLYSLNPLVGVIDGFRACLLGNDIEWLYVFPGMAVTVVLMVTGALYFKRMEKVFVDVI